MVPKSRKSSSNRRLNQRIKQIKKKLKRVEMTFEFNYDSDAMVYCLVQLNCCLFLINSLKGKFEILETLLI